MIITRVRATLNYGSGGPGLFTAYFVPGTTGGSVADATDCIARVRACFQSLVAQFVATQTIQVQNDVQAFEATTGALTGQFSGTPAALVTGTASGSSTPQAAMILVRARTNSIINNRVLRGRHYVGPVSNTATLAPGGGVAGTTVAAFSGAFTGMLVTTPTLSFPCVWHRPVNGANGGHALVSSYSPWDQYGVMRSRRDS